MPPDKDDQTSAVLPANTALAESSRPDAPVPGDSSNLHADLRSRLLCDATIDIASALFCVSGDKLRSHGRAPRDITRVRQVAMYAAHTVLGVSQREVGLAFGRDRTTVVHACHTIEDLRDDKAFDQAVMLLETILMAAFRVRLEAPWR